MTSGSTASTRNLTCTRNLVVRLAQAFDLLRGVDHDSNVIPLGSGEALPLRAKLTKKCEGRTRGSVHRGLVKEDNVTRLGLLKELLHTDRVELPPATHVLPAATLLAPHCR